MRSLLSSLTMPARVFMQDVATQCGVHRTTVSLALRGHPRIPADTRDHIIKVAEKLGYRMDPFLSALMHAKRVGASTPKHAVLAYITCHSTRNGWKTDPFLPDYFPGAASRARELGFKLEHFWATEPDMSPVRLSNILSTRNIHGLVLAPPPTNVKSIELDWSRFSVVMMGVGMASPEAHRIYNNHFHTSSLAIKKCVERGFRRIGYCGPHLEDGYREVNERWLGAFSAAAYEFIDAELLPPLFVDHTDLKKLTAWIGRHKPEVIISAGIGVQLLRSQNRIRIPDDVSLVGLNLEGPGDSIAGIYHNPAINGAAAVDLLTSLMHQCERGLPPQPHDLTVRGSWIEGPSLPDKKAKKPHF